LGALLSWNTFRVGSLEFRGKVGLLNGPHLTVLIVAGFMVFRGVVFLRDPASATNVRGALAFLFAPLIGLIVLLQYAIGEQAALERWVVGPGAALQAGVTGQPLQQVVASLQASIRAGDASLAPGPGLVLAFVGVALGLIAGFMTLHVVRNNSRKLAGDAVQTPDTQLVPGSISAASIAEQREVLESAISEPPERVVRS
jgi:hypothetical protein